MIAQTDIRVRDYPARIAMMPHAHDCASVSLVVNGNLLERIGRSERDYARGAIAFFPAGVVHSQLFGAFGARQIIVTPNKTLLDYLAECGLKIAEAPHARAANFSLFGDRLLEEMRADDGFSGLVREGIVLEMVATFGRTIGRTRGAPPAWLRAARDFLHENASAPLAMREIARACGRHEIHVAREFRRYYGTSVGDHLRQLRTERAAALLLASRDGISMIALDCGFANHSHLCREFRRRFGVTPSYYRARRAER